MINFLFASLAREFIFFVLLPFILWTICWWDYICGKLALGFDFYSYYWDSRFFLDNIRHGVYPLWNPGYAGGVPWDFFLRRMGEVNPFYWTVNGFRALGATPLHAHLAFFVLYYFLGLVGFWLLARLFLKDRTTSIAAYLLLLFSWGGQLFYCFDVLMFVPLAWFFYFIFAFAQAQKKHQFLGACFSLALMITAYVPFFTLTVVGSFLFFVFLFFMRDAVAFFTDFLKFAGARRFFMLICLGFLAVACLPEIGLYHESTHGAFTMPTRHLGSSDDSQLAVAVNNKNSEGGINYSRTVWDIIAYGYFDKVFAHQQDLTIGDFYIAYPFFIVLLLSIINPASRRTALLLVSGVFLTLITMTKSHLYPFCLDHVFFFRYMRMLHLFLWLAMLPMAILMVMEQLRVFLQNHQARQNIKLLVFVIVAHVLFFIWLLMQPGILWCSYLSVGISLVFFICSLMGWANREILALIWWLSLMIQPVAFVHYIIQNSQPQNFIIDRYCFYGHALGLPPKGLGVTPVTARPGDRAEKSAGSYYSNPWMGNLQQYANQEDIDRFMAAPLMLFDKAPPADPPDLGFLDHTPPAAVVYQDDPRVKVIAYDANTLKIATHLDHPQFLLWANGYHPQWHVYVDGVERRLSRTDVAFKGAWVPPGNHLVVFRFAKPLRYALEYVLLLVFGLALAALLALGFREGFLV